MAEKFSISAILSATDKNMSSTFKRAMGVAETFGDRVKSIVAGVGVTKALGAAVNTLTSSLDGAITRYDTLHTYPKVMQSLGYSTQDAEASVSKLNAAVQGLPTSLSDIVKNAQVMTSVTGNMDKATATAIALNDALLSSSASTEDAARATQQYSQMLATGKPDLEAWRTLQETMSPALTKVAKKLGIASGNTLELYNAINDGKISFDDFNTALIECDTEVGGFADTAKDASKTIRTGFTNIKSAVENFEMSVIGAVNSIINSEGFGGIVDVLDNIKTAIYNVRNAFMESSNGIDYVFKPEVLKNVEKAFKTIAKLVDDVIKGFRGSGAIQATTDALSTCSVVFQRLVRVITQSKVFQTIAYAFGSIHTVVMQVVSDIALVVDKFINLQTINQICTQVMTAVKDLKDTLLRAWEAFKDTGAIDTAIETLLKVKDAILNVVDAAANSGAIEKLAGFFGELVKQVSLVIGYIADFISGLDDQTIETFANVVEKLIEAYVGYKIIKTAGTEIKKFGEKAKNAVSGVKSLYDNVKKLYDGLKEGKSLKDIFGKQDTPETDPKPTGGSSGVEAIKAKWEGIANTVEKAGSSIREAMNGIADIIKSVGSTIADAARGIGDGVKTALEGVAQVFESAGKGISTAAKGIGEGIKSALEGVGTVIESIGTAIKSVLEGLAPVIESLGTALATVAKGIGEGISIALQGLGKALASIPATTWLAIAAAALAFGAALALVGSQGEGLQMVLNGVATVINSILPIVQTVVTGIITGLSMLPAIFASVAAVIDTACSGISDVVNTLGDNISKVVDTVSDGMSKIIDSIGDAISGVLDSLAGIIDSIGEAALNAGKGFDKLADGLVKITNLNLLDLGASMLTVTAALASVTAFSGGLATAGQGMKDFASGLQSVSMTGTIAATALLTITTAMSTLSGSMTNVAPTLDSASASMQTFATNATVAFAGLMLSATSAAAFVMTLNMMSSGAATAAASVSALAAAASSVTGAVSSLGSIGSSAMQSLISSFQQAQSAARSAGTAISNDLVKGVQSGLKQLPSIATSAINSFTSALQSGQAAAYSAGSYIGQGLANGIRSQIGAVRAAAASLAAAADAAIQAKARIGSPSKVTTKDGQWIGQGLVNGIKAMYGQVQRAADGLFDIPQLNSPQVAFAGINGQLSQDYNYYHEAEYTINVPLSVDGKQFAKATATYTQEELDQRSKFQSRLLGVKS